MRARNLAVVFACGVAALTASCGKREPVPVLIGLNLESTGDIAMIGRSAQEAADLFFAQQNEAGGVQLADGPHKFSIITLDNGANATQASAAAQQLVSRDNVIALVGPNSGKCANAAANIAEALKCVMITPWSPDAATTMDPIAGVPKRYVFRAGATDDVQGRVMARFALDKLGARTAAIISDADAGPTAQAAGFKEAFSAGGGQIVAQKSIGTDDRNFARHVEGIAPPGPEIVFVAAPCDRALPVLEAAKAAGINAKFLGTDLWNSPQTIRMTALGIDGLYFCRNFDHRDADPATKEFVEAYTAKYNRAPDDVAALTYDACAIIAAALKKSGKNERESLRESLARLSNLEGATGTFDFEPGSGDPSKSMPVLEIKSSGFEWVGDAGP